MLGLSQWLLVSAFFYDRHALLLSTRAAGFGPLKHVSAFLPSCRLQVMQVLNADAIVVKLNSGDYKTIHLSSIRPPRLEGENTQVR